MQSAQSTGIDMDTNSSWYALYTRHQHEKSVTEMLSAKGFEVFLPLYKSQRLWKDRKKILMLPLFPCYVFVRVEAHRRLHVLTTPGVFTILHHGDHPAVIPEDEIGALRKTVARNYGMEPHPFLKSGERVRVINGALEGVEGFIVRQKSQFRLILSVNLLCKAVAVEIDAVNVEPVAAPAQASFTRYPQFTKSVGQLPGIALR